MCGALREPASSDARASEGQLTVYGEVSLGLSMNQDWLLILGLALHGVVLASGLVTNDDAMGWQVVLLLMHILARGIP